MEAAQVNFHQRLRRPCSIKASLEELLLSLPSCWEIRQDQAGTGRPVANICVHAQTVLG